MVADFPGKMEGFVHDIAVGAEAVRKHRIRDELAKRILAKVPELDLRELLEVDKLLRKLDPTYGGGENA